MFMRQALLKKLWWIPKREIMRKRKKKSLGIRVLLFFFPHEAI